MLYRKMNKAAPELSILGFGCMRLPVTENGQIDEDQATGMLRYAIDNGVNYIDTAYPYHNGGSEPFVGRALAGGYREKVNLATKLPSWLVTSREDMDKYLNEQLARLGTDHIDFYLVHGLNRQFWDNLLALGVTEFLDEAVSDGRIRYAGFSFHDNVSLFKEIVDAYDWTFAQIQYNFMDEHYQAGTEGLEYAAKKGLGIVVMEPVRGGLLARDLAGVKEIWQMAKARHPPAAWALRWVWNHPEVTVVLSGMSSPEQVRQNVALAKKGLAGSLTHAELSLYVKVRDELEKRVIIPCTGCKYCVPCPHGVSIPECFEMFNRGHIYEDEEQARQHYSMFLGGFFDGKPHFASVCEECGECEEKCPQGLPIREHLKAVAEYFGK
ncbi:aldo/keto reductase [Methanoregula sp.]|uniref:aldo/keto reductase n=1 Tax=Methanoregula sp. TaxID=2052170 RepID=UPI003C723882